MASGASIVDRLYPPRCLVCGLRSAAPGVCEACTAELPWNVDACPRCAQPVNVTLSAAADGAADDDAAPACLACHYRPPPWDAAVAPLRYALPVVGLVQAFKFARRLDHGRWLAAALADAVRHASAAAAAPLPQALLAVPMHPARLRRRGFNQAAVLAAALARDLGLVDAGASLARRRATPPQARLDAAARRANLAGAFALASALPAGVRHVALVDDVLTTGATAEALTRLLREGAGIEQVDVWCCARTITHPGDGAARGDVDAPVNGTDSPERGR